MWLLLSLKRLILKFAFALAENVFNFQNEKNDVFVILKESLFQLHKLVDSQTQQFHSCLVVFGHCIIVAGQFAGSRERVSLWFIGVFDLLVYAQLIPRTENKQFWCVSRPPEFFCNLVNLAMRSCGVDNLEFFLRVLGVHPLLPDKGTYQQTNRLAWSGGTFDEQTSIVENRVKDRLHVDVLNVGYGKRELNLDVFLKPLGFFALGFIFQGNRESEFLGLLVGFGSLEFVVVLVVKVLEDLIGGVENRLLLFHILSH